MEEEAGATTASYKVIAKVEGEEEEGKCRDNKIAERKSLKITIKRSSRIPLVRIIL